MGRYMITLDPQRCIGCGACEVQCQTKSHTPPGVRPAQILTASLPAETSAPRLAAAFRPCFHCETPWCVAACPTGAMVKRTEDGLVRVIEELCVGCRACIGACPWKVPQWDESTELVVKCDGCFERVADGLAPACVAGCATRALSFSRPNENVRHVRSAFAKSLVTEAGIDLH